MAVTGRAKELDADMTVKLGKATAANAVLKTDLGDKAQGL